MKRSMFGACVASVAVGVSLAALPARTSDPIGIYCIVERVVLTPADRPDTAEIWGAFVLANVTLRRLDPAAKGYLYYTITPGKEEAVRREWSDLKSVAGKDEVVGFGGFHTPTGRLRAATEKPAGPDVYPVNFGVLRIGAPNYNLNISRDIIQQLRTAVKGR